MKIRKATLKDMEAIWGIFHEVIKTGDTYVFDPKTPKRIFINIGLPHICIRMYLKKITNMRHLYFKTKPD